MKLKWPSSRHLLSSSHLIQVDTVQRNNKSTHKNAVNYTPGILRQCFDSHILADLIESLFNTNADQSVEDRRIQDIDDCE